MSSPAVTVVVTAYQRLDYLRQALASAVAQTYRDFELIVCDDGASDEMAALVDSFRDPRLRYRRNTRKLGVAMNHRAGYDEARGRYISNLDDDDVWEPEFLETLIAPLEADPSVVLVFCDHHIIDAESRLMPKRANDLSRLFRRVDVTPGRHAEFFEMAVVAQSIPIAMGAMFRRSLLDAEFPPRIGGSYDYWLAYLAAKSGHAVFYVPQRLTRYRIHPRSGTATQGPKNLRDVIYVQRRFLKDPQLAPQHEFLRNNLGISYGKLGLIYLKPGTYRRAGILLRRAFSLIHRWKNHLGLAKNCLARWVMGRAT